MAIPRYYPEFVKALEKYSGIKKSVKKKIENLLINPLGFGESLKYELVGLNSCSVKKNFIIIFVYCRECRIKNYCMINDCKGCDTTPDEVVKFLTIGPHDVAYHLARKIDK